MAAAAAAGGNKPDVVAQLFAEQQAALRKLMAESDKLTVPFDGDDAAKKQYADQYEALLAKLKIPSLYANVDSALAEAKEGAADVRSFVKGAFALRSEFGLGDSEAETRMLAELDAAEASLGKPLTFADAAQCNKLGDAMLDIVGSLVGKSGAELAASEEQMEKDAIYKLYSTEIAEGKAKRDTLMNSLMGK